MKPGLIVAWSPLLISLALHAGFFVCVRGRDTQSALGPSTRPAPIDVSVSEKRVAPRVKVTASAAIASTNVPVAMGLAPSSDENQGALAMDGYAAQVREQIGRSLQYPLQLQRRRISGRVGLKLTLDPQGRVQSHEITQTAGALDELAVAAVREAEPFPEPPPGLKNDGRIVLNLPIDFKLAR